MRAIFGLLLVMLGLAMAVLWRPDHDSELQLAVATEIATKGVGFSRDRPFATDDKGARTFSPKTPLLATVEPTGQRAPQYTVGVARVIQTPQMQPDGAAASVLVRNLPQAHVSAPLPSSSAGGLVSPLAPAGRLNEGVQHTAMPATGEMKRDELIRGIQRELKRVGCYYGDVDGDWGSGSKRAMSNFTDQVNASLPVDRPDFILLTLLRGHSGTACGKGCPAGQSMLDNGRCIPGAVVAQGVARTFDGRAAQRDGNRMAYAATAGERLHAQTAPPRSQSPAGAWTTSVQREAVTAVPLPPPVAASKTLPPPQQAVASVAGTTTATAAAPIPGRMAIGGPSAGPAYVVQPPERSLAQDAVRAESESELAARAPTTRERSRRTARRSPSSWSSSYAYGFPVPSATVYRSAPRASASRYYAYAAPRRGRSWTGTFFGNTP